MELSKKKLVDVCEGLSIKVSKKDTAKDLMEKLKEHADDLNTWMEAVANSKKDAPVKKVNKAKKGIYLGKCVNTGEKLYA